MNMGASKSQPLKSKHILWLDTEGGVRDVPLWDVTIINENLVEATAHRFCSASLATKRGRSRLAKALPSAVFEDSRKSGSTCVLQYKIANGKWMIDSAANVSAELSTLLAGYLLPYKGSVLCAWNLKGHDRHVLARAVGQTTLDKFVLWDALPWFRSNYVLPKNTMASNKAGTPRGVFDVPVIGDAHDSFADAAHMREVVLRAASCLKNDGTMVCLTDYKRKTREEQFKCVQNEIDESVTAAEWHDVVHDAWVKGMIPETVYKPAGVPAKLVVGAV